MTPLRQQRAYRAMMRLLMQALCPKIVTFPQLRPRRETPGEAVVRICAGLGMTVEEVLSRSNKYEHACARHIIAHYLIETMGLSYSAAGMILGRAHATMISSIRQYNNLAATKEHKFMRMINKVQNYERNQIQRQER